MAKSQPKTVKAVQTMLRSIGKSPTTPVTIGGGSKSGGKKR